MSQEISIKSKEKTILIAESIANGQEYAPHEMIMLSLAEFKSIYSELVRQFSNRNPYVLLIYFDDMIYASFPQHSMQRFRLPRMQKRHYLMPKDFEFIHLPISYGTLERLQSFGQFLVSELRLYWMWLAITFVTSFIGLHFAGSDTVYSTLAGVLIQSATVFVSVFLIFTVTQSALLQNDPALFRRGILHRYRRADRNVAILGIIVIGAVIFNSMFVLLPEEYSKLLAFSPFGYALTLQNFWGALSTSLVIALLLDAFISVVGYYLDRSQDVTDRDFIQQTFTETEARFQSPAHPKEQGSTSIGSTERK